MDLSAHVDSAREELLFIICLFRRVWILPHLLAKKDILERPGEMVQLLKCLSCKHQDPGVDSQHPSIKLEAAVMRFRDLSPGEVER